MYDAEQVEYQYRKSYKIMTLWLILEDSNDKISDL